MTAENRKEGPKSAENHDVDVKKTEEKEVCKELVENAALEEAADSAKNQVTAGVDGKNVLEEEAVNEKDKEQKEGILGDESKKEVASCDEEPTGVVGKVISEWVPNEKTPTEAMLRMQAFIESGWMSINERIFYRISETAIYWASVDEYGILWRERRNPDGTPFRGLGYTSPTDFAVAMATEYVRGGGEKLWRNGPGSVNGWEVCKTCRRDAVSLQQLRKDFLRSKKLSQAKQSEDKRVMGPGDAPEEDAFSEHDGKQENVSRPVKDGNNVDQNLVKDSSSARTGSSSPPKGAQVKQLVHSDPNSNTSPAVGKDPSVVSQERSEGMLSEKGQRQTTDRDMVPQADPMNEDTAATKSRNVSESMKEDSAQNSDRSPSDSRGTDGARSGPEKAKEEHGKVPGKEKDEVHEDNSRNSRTEEEKNREQPVAEITGDRGGDPSVEKVKEASEVMDSEENDPRDGEDKNKKPEASPKLKGPESDLENNATRDKRGELAESTQGEERANEETASGVEKETSKRVEKEFEHGSGGNVILAEAAAGKQELASVHKEKASGAKQESAKRDEELSTRDIDNSKDVTVLEVMKSPSREDNTLKVKAQARIDREVEKSHLEGFPKDNKSKEGRSSTSTKRKRSDLETRDSPISTPKRARLRVEADAALLEDPAAAEAAAVAAAADKAEARRTTRLAAGKIKQVDYNAPITIKRPDSVSAADEASNHVDSGRASASSTGAEKPRRMRTTRSSRSRPYGDPQADEETGSGHRDSSGGDTDGDDGGSGERTSKSGSSSSHTASVSPGPSSTLLPTDDQGWNHAAIGILGSVVRSVNSLEPDALIPVLKSSSDWKAQGRSDNDVSEYVSMLKKRIMDFCPGLFATHVRTAAFLSFLANNMHRLMYESERSESNAVAQVAQERRLRASFDKKRKRAKKELEEVRGRLDNEMENRRESDMQGAYLEVRIADARRALERERGKQEDFSREIEFYERKKADLVNRIRNVAAMRPEEGLYTSDDTLENRKGELRRLKNVVAESEMELMKSISRAEESRARVETLIKEKLRLESELYISRTGRRVVDRKRRAEATAKAVRKRRRKGIPIKSPCE